MEIIKRKYLLLGIMLALARGAIFADELYEEQLIENTYNVVFGKTRGNLFNEDNFYLDQYRNIGNWNAMLTAIGEFVDDNAGKNKKLHNAFDTCEEVSNQLVNTLQAIYRDVFSPSGELDPDGILMAHNALRTLNDSGNDLVVEKEILRNVTFYIKGKKKNKAREVLLTLITYLEIAIDKLNRSFEAKLRERGWS